MELQKATNIDKLSVVGLNKNYRYDIKKFNDFIGGRFISPDLIKAYFEQMKLDGKSPSTIGRHKASIKQAILKMSGQGVTLIQRAQIDVFLKRSRRVKETFQSVKNDY